MKFEMLPISVAACYDDLRLLISLCNRLPYLILLGVTEDE